LGDSSQPQAGKSAPRAFFAFPARGHGPGRETWLAAVETLDKFRSRHDT